MSWNIPHVGQPGQESQSRERTVASHMRRLMAAKGKCGFFDQKLVISVNTSGRVARVTVYAVSSALTSLGDQLLKHWAYTFSERYAQVFLYFTGI
jgi:hypothetical protein